MLKLDLSRVNRAISKAFDVVVDAQEKAFNDAIVDEIWEWTRPTDRSNGETVTSPRDIVDSGELLDSLEVARSANEAEFTWTVDYAIYVQYGVTLKNGTVLPARDWVALGVAECDRAKIMQQQINKLL